MNRKIPALQLPSPFASEEGRADSPGNGESPRNVPIRVDSNEVANRRSSRRRKRISERSGTPLPITALLPTSIDSPTRSSISPIHSPNLMSPLTSPRTVMCVGNYDLGETIGRGRFGKVKLATHVLTKENVCSIYKNNFTNIFIRKITQVAVKIIRKCKLTPDTIPLVEQEIKILKTVSHENVIRLLEIYETEKVVFLVTEYASGGEVIFYLILSRYLFLIFFNLNLATGFSCCTR